MSGPLAAELRKLWTLRTTWVLSAIGFGLVLLSTGELMLAEVVVGPDTAAVERTATAVAQVGNNSIIVLVVALLVMTSEFRHDTVGRTLQLTPSRGRVLIAKLGAGALFAATFFVISTGLVAVTLSVGSVLGGEPLVLSAEVGRALWHGLAGLVLTGALGVAIGALVRSQVVAITASLAWLFIVENLAAAMHYGIGRWLPVQALHAVFLGDAAQAIEPGVIGPLGPSVAMAVFLGYVVAATSTAGVLMTVRDV